MRHGRADSLIDRYVDGTLKRELAGEVAAHAAGCARCSRRIAAARALVSALSAEPAARAPRGFAERVMNAVYREALRGAPEPAAGLSRAAAEAPGTAAAGASGPAGPAPAAPPRMYRRLGLSFVLTAAVLAASLLISSAAYPALFRPRGAAGSGPAAVWEPGTAGGALVKGMLDGAGITVRGALHPAGGRPSGSPGGSLR